jgi:hypothetical protein
VQNEGRAVIALAPPEAAHGPFHPQERDAHEQETHEVGNDECAATVLDGLHREAQEIAQAHGIARHGQDQSHA